MSTPPPNDSSSLLVPIYLDAWAVNEQTQEGMAWYYANYSNLQQFVSPIPDPFDVSSGDKPALGIHLHWALPDALTNAVQQPDGSFSFPFVPNRWLVVRFSGNGAKWAMNAWVVQSDYLSTEPGQGTSAFLDPANPSGISNDGSTVTVNSAQVGTNYSVQAWQAQGDPGTRGFLQAVGPGNISFAAYKPFSENVFSFIDSSENLPAHGPFSYMVVGWYSDAASDDPLRGINTWLPNVWPNQSDWSAQTPAQRFTALLGAMNWSLPAGTAAPAAPPVSSLYHSFIADVTWPYGTYGYTKPVQVAVGNTAADALSALIQNYAKQQSLSDPTHASQWTMAGNTLGSLIQAAMFDLLDDYGQPGGAVQVQQKVEQSWFGSDPGGTIWRVIPTTPQDSAFSVADDGLTPAQNLALLQQLSALNAVQQKYDGTQRQLQSGQGELYRLWLKLSQAQNYLGDEIPETTPDFSSVLMPVLQNDLYPGQFNAMWDLLCAQQAAPSLVQNPSDAAGANVWANSNWTFPASSGGGTVTLEQLGLQLKATTAERFWHPADPVLLICGAGRTPKHGQDGSFNADGTLTCRLPGQTITGLTANGQPAVTAAAVAAKVQFDQLGSYTAVPAIPTLLTEAFFSDPLNGNLMAAAVSGAQGSVLQSTILQLLEDDTSAGTWQGTPPSPLAYQAWDQAWSPLFLEWMVNYYPTVSDVPGDFDLGAWTFDGSQYTWNGAGINPGGNPYALNFSGRTVVTPYAQNVLQQKLGNYLQGHSAIDSPQLEALLQTMAGWDILSQTLSGLTDQLITLLSQETFPPPKGDGAPLTCPRPSVVTAPPPVGALVQDQYHLMPVLSGDGNDHNFFFPLRGGLVTFPPQRLQIVDAFGQTYDLTQPNTPQGFQPLISPSLQPPGNVDLPDGLNAPFVLGPRLAQSTRLDLTLLANDGTGHDIVTSPNANPVCGWLLPNHLDGSIAVYDGSGTLLGEIWPLPAPANWRPRPGPPGATPPPATPGDIANAALNKVVSALAAQTVGTLEDFLQVIDETLWMVDPLGGRTDAFLSTLIGRPLAVVQMEVGLSLKGPTAANQMWDFMLTSDSTASDYTVVQDTGGLPATPFPVRLGSLELRNDGLMGYFLTAGDDAYARFYTAHTSPEVSSGDTFIQPILDTSGGTPVYQGDLSVLPAGPGVTVTMILDPRGCVHGYTGVLPVTSVMLDGNRVQDFLKTMKVNFQTGPILADPGSLRTPQPAEKQGTWSWLQNIGGTWQQDAIVDPTDTARHPLQPPVLREGWLQLSDYDGKD